MLRRFATLQSGTTAIEFALLAGPFLLIIIATVELGVKSFIQAELDRVLTDVTSNLSLVASDAAEARIYVDTTICSLSGPLLDCGQLDFGATAVNGRLFDYRNQSLSGMWDLGCAGDTVLVELTYAYEDMIVPFAVADVVEVGGAKRYRSRAVLRREPILSGSGACG